MLQPEYTTLKNMKTIVSILVAMMLLSTSCSTLRIEKRRYQNGWHVDRVGARAPELETRETGQAFSERAKSDRGIDTIHTNDNKEKQIIKTDSDTLIQVAVESPKQKIDFPQKNSSGYTKADHSPEPKQVQASVKNAERIIEPRLWKALLLEALLFIALAITMVLLSAYGIGLFFLFMTLIALITGVLALFMHKNKPEKKIIAEEDRKRLWFFYLAFAALMSTFLTFLVLLIIRIATTYE